MIAELAHGFEVGTNPGDGRPWTIVADRLAPKNPGTIADEVRLLKKITPKMIKATLPAPALLGERMWDAKKSSRAYPKREDFVRDCVPILRKELELLRDSGASIIQIDDPHLCLFVDPEVRKTYDDPEGAARVAGGDAEGLGLSRIGVRGRHGTDVAPVRGVLGDRRMRAPG